MANKESPAPFFPARSDLSGPHAAGSGSKPMPDPKPLIEKFLAWALELGILSYVAFTKEITPSEIFEMMKDDEENRARVYSACTGLDVRLVPKFVPDFARQAEDIGVAIETDDRIARAFAEAVGYRYYVEHVPLEKIYVAVNSTEWMFDPPTPKKRRKDEVRTEAETARRAFAARQCNALVEHEAFGSPMVTYERVMKALTLDALFGDAVPAELRIRMIKAANVAVRSAETVAVRLGENMLSPERGGVSFEELSQHLDVKTMAEPFAFYAVSAGIVHAKADESEAPPAGDHAASADVPAPPPLPGAKADEEKAGKRDSLEPEVSIAAGDGTADDEDSVDLDIEGDGVQVG